mmetsp:Transcript_5630/g.12769  ORF Transcript_5630/g.12769 Transcript_5630/m.12769 type:complete len:151 (+) Transcript_5630:71-523(+)
MARVALLPTIAAFAFQLSVVSGTSLIRHEMSGGEGKTIKAYYVECWHSLLIKGAKDLPKKELVDKCKRACGHGMFGTDVQKRFAKMASKKTQGWATSQLRRLTAKKCFLALKATPPTGGMCDHLCYKNTKDCKGEDCGLLCRLILRDRRP